MTRSVERQFVDLGAVELERGGVLPAVRVAYETWGELNAAGDNAILVEHALTGDSHVEGPTGPGHPTPGWWDGLIGPGSAPRHRPLLRRGRQRPRRLPGQHRPVLAAPRRRPVGQPLPVRHGARPGADRGPARRRPRHRPLARRPRRLDGRDAGPRVGGDPPRAGRRRPSCWPARHTPRRSRSAGARRSCWRSAPTRTSTAATTTSAAPGPRPGWGSRDGSRTSPTAASSSCTSASVASRSRPRTRWADTGGTPSSPTSTTTPASWPDASTPTPTSSSPRR